MFKKQENEMVQPLGNKAKKFEDLIFSPEKLQFSLEQNPHLINEQDEQGRTLLHHVAASMKFFSNEGSVAEGLRFDQVGKQLQVYEQVLDTLLCQPELDLTRVDAQGDTALHLAVKEENFFSTAMDEIIMTRLVKKAQDTHFDFSTWGKEGKTILHLAVEKENLKILQILLRNAKNLNFMCLSEEGFTAMNYAIAKALKAADSYYNNRSRLEWYNEGITMLLLDAGANPPPVKLIDSIISQMEEARRLADSMYTKEDLDIMISSLERVLNKVKAKTSVVGIGLFQLESKEREDNDDARCLLNNNSLD